METWIPSVLILGASARAAVFSALRAGLEPWCADLFADADLRPRCPAARLTGPYPHGFQTFIDGGRPGPWMYAGGLENWPRLVRRWARRRPLWGSTASSLGRARSPEYVEGLLRSAGMPVPILARGGEGRDPSRGWLLKPRRGASGIGIRFLAPTAEGWQGTDAYCQEFIEGQPLSLLFLGGEGTARLLGVTRQLVGAPWLHAAPFRYCGNIGPVDPELIRRPPLEELGRLLASGCRLSGLFGVDGVCRDGTFWPVEINPRYTASVEVLEHATGAAFLGRHAEVFRLGRLPPLPLPAGPSARVVGKAILFAPEDFTFPADGQWTAELHSPRPVWELPAFADIPGAGEPVRAGRPILTFFAEADTASACEARLRQIAADLDRRLFGR